MTTDDRPTALDLPMVDPLPEATAKYFQVCQDKLGMVPNVLKAHAFDIEKLNAFTGLYNELMLADSGLSKLEREMIAVVVSSVNRCFYCLTAHGAAVRSLSGDPKLGELMVMNWRAADLSERHVAMLGFAEKVTKASAEVLEADRQALRDEFDANDGSFLAIALSGHWDAASLERLAQRMYSACAYYQDRTPVPKWIASGFHHGILVIRLLR